MMHLAPTVMSTRGLTSILELYLLLLGGHIFFLGLFDGMVTISNMHVKNSKCFQLLIILHEVVISPKCLRANET
jgi:hypothetical protein